MIYSLGPQNRSVLVPEHRIANSGRIVGKREVGRQLRIRTKHAVLGREQQGYRMRGRGVFGGGRPIIQHHGVPASRKRSRSSSVWREPQVRGRLEASGRGAASAGQRCRGTSAKSLQRTADRGPPRPCSSLRQLQNARGRARGREMGKSGAGVIKFWHMSNLSRRTFLGGAALTASAFRPPAEAMGIPPGTQTYPFRNEDRKSTRLN